MNTSKITRQQLESYLSDREWALYSESISYAKGSASWVKNLVMVSFEWSTTNSVVFLTEEEEVINVGNPLMECKGAIAKIAETESSSIASLLSELKGYKRRQSQPALESQFPTSGLVPVPLTCSLPKEKADFLLGVSPRSRTVADFLLNHWDEFKKFSERD